MRRPRTTQSAFVASFALSSASSFPVVTFSRHFESKVGHQYECASSLSSDDTSCLDEASADEEAVRKQLGYLPINYVRVTSYTSRGKEPVAIQTYPLNGGATRRRSKAKGELTPFPTLYWLANAEISRAVAELERTGFVGALEERLRSKDSYVEDYIRAHQAYANERWQSLTGQDRAMLLEGAAEENDEGEGGSNGNRNDVITPGMVQMIRNSGIAGRKPPFEASIKCLHSHYAHYRSGGGEVNIVGKWVEDLLLENFPELDL